MTDDLELVQRKIRTENVLKGGANWFFWIGLLSLINSMSVLVGSKFQFVVGLAITQVIDGIALLYPGGQKVAVVIDVAIAGFFIWMGVLAKRGQSWSFVLGFILYSLDGMLSLVFKDWIGLVFHGLALAGIYQGWRAQARLKDLTVSDFARWKPALSEFRNGPLSKVEYVRARWPSPVYWVLFTLFTGAVMMVALGAADRFGIITPAREGLTLDKLSLIPLVGAFVVGLIFLGIGRLAKFSGYTPFEHRWSIHGPTEQESFSEALWQASLAAGFQPVWKGMGGSFVAVHRSRATDGELIAPSDSAPLLLFLDVDGSSGRVVMRVKVRTDVFWNSGEKERCQRVGQSLLSEAGRLSGQTIVGTGNCGSLS